MRHLVEKLMVWVAIIGGSTLSLLIVCGAVLSFWFEITRPKAESHKWKLKALDHAEKHIGAQIKLGERIAKLKEDHKNQLEYIKGLCKRHHSTPETKIAKILDFIEGCLKE